MPENCIISKYRKESNQIDSTIENFFICSICGLPLTCLSNWFVLISTFLTGLQIIHCKTGESGLGWTKALQCSPVWIFLTSCAKIQGPTSWGGGCSVVGFGVVFWPFFTWLSISEINLVMFSSVIQNICHFIAHTETINNLKILLRDNTF